MKTQIETCSKCGKHITGEMQLGMGNGFIQGFAQGAIKEGLDMIAPGIGFVAKHTGITEKAGNYVRETVTTHTNFAFSCPCGNTWVSRIGNNEERIPDEILNQQKSWAILRCSQSMSGNFTVAVITGILFLLCVWYLIVNPFIVEVPDHNWLMGDYMRQDWQLGWIGMFILACATGIPAFYNLSKGINKQDDLKTLKNMGLSRFKKSDLRKKYV